MEWASSASASSSNTWRGCLALAWIASTGNSAKAGPGTAPNSDPLPGAVRASSARPSAGEFKVVAGRFRVSVAEPTLTTGTSAGPRIPSTGGAVGIREPRPRPSPPRRFLLFMTLTLRRCRRRWAGAPFGDLPRGMKVSDGAAGAGVVGDDGLTEARRLGDADVAWDRRRQHQVTEVAPDLVRDLVGESGPAVVHGEQHRRDLQPRVEVRGDEVDRPE